MSNSSIEERVKDLQERFVNEKRNKNEGAFLTPVGLGAPRLGSGRKPRPALMLPSKDMQGFPPRTQHNVEQEKRFREVYKVSGKLNVGGVEYRSHIDDLQLLGELGSGTCGQVVKMMHKTSGAVIAVKQMRRSGNSEETKRILMDLDVVVCSHDCPYIVRCFGCFVTEADVWICMELMASCFDKLLKRLGAPIPELILGKVTVATVNALSYLKDSHGVIHRDVKPSNILLDERGNVKLCDFGISGRLVDSKAKTRGAGCAAYMAPERIEPPDPSKPVYDIRADVWSLGISLVELATGVLPYKDCQNDFEVLTRVLKEDPPRLPKDKNFTPEFKSFVSQCLTKDVENRPKYAQLLEHPFVVKSTRSRVSVGDWYASLPQGAGRGGNITSVATHNVGGSNGVDTSPVYVTSAQHWIDQVTPQPQRAIWATTMAANAGGSSSQPASLEADLSNMSPAPRRRTLEACASPPPPPPPVRRVSADNRWRPSPVTSGNTSPIVLQRFYHQKQQRRSRVDQHAAPRHRSLSREHSTGRSPEPPPRTSRHHHMLGHEVTANGSSELEPPPPPLHERLHPHPPSPLLLSNRLSECRSQSLTRADVNGFRREPSAPAPPPSRLRHDEPSVVRGSEWYAARSLGNIASLTAGWLHSLAGLVKRRLTGYVKWQHLVGNHGQATSSRQPYVQNSRWHNAESWSMPASPLPPRAPPPRPSD